MSDNDSLPHDRAGTERRQPARGDLSPNSIQALVMRQHHKGLGCVQLYEHDFETRTYRPSLRFDAGRLIPVAT